MRKAKQRGMRMNKEELIKLLETLNLEEVKSLKIVYYTERNYVMYDNRKPTTLTINEKGESDER